MPTLDGWRAIAIIFVVIAHGSDSISNTLDIVGINFDFSRIKEAGLFGVQIFFGLSGLLITSRLIASENKYRVSLRLDGVAGFSRGWVEAKKPSKVSWLSVICG